MSFLSKFAESAKEFKKLRSLVLASLLVALGIALNSVNINLNAELRISVSFVALASAGLLFGPVMAMAAGAATDIVSYLLFPKGAFFPGFTVTAIVAGLIYGLFFYGYECTKWLWLRAFAAKGLVNLVCNIGLNTLWLSMLGGKAMTVLWPARAVKNALLWPFESLLLIAVLVAVNRIWMAMGKQKGKPA
jgi:ECF transporter S component (folate family)